MGSKISIICYTNWRNETSMRKILPSRIYYGEVSFHKGPQWLLEALDVDKNEPRTFATKDIHFWG